MILNHFSWLLIAVGCFFSLTGIIGMLRFKDLYNKLHCNGISDSLGLPLILIGLSLLHNNIWGTIKIMLMIPILYLTSPISTHIIAKLKYKKDSKDA